MGETFAIPPGMNGGWWRPDGVVDLDTLSATFVPRRVSQDVEPTLSVGEMALWNDSDDGITYLMYRDVTLGQIGINLAASGSYSLDDLSDVEILAPAVNEILAYDGADWVNIDSPTFAGLDLNGLLDLDRTSAATSGDIAGVDATLTATGSLTGSTTIEGVSSIVSWNGTSNDESLSVLGGYFDLSIDSALGADGVAIGLEVDVLVNVTSVEPVTGIYTQVTKSPFGVTVPTAYGLWIGAVEGTTAKAIYNESNADCDLGTGTTTVGTLTDGTATLTGGALTGVGSIAISEDGCIGIAGPAERLVFDGTEREIVVADASLTIANDGSYGNSIRLNTHGDGSPDYIIADRSYEANEVYDHVLYIAYNRLPTGGRMDESEPYLAFAMESHFYNEVQHLMEINLDYMSASGSSTRFMGFGVDRETDIGIWTWQADTRFDNRVKIGVSGGFPTASSTLDLEAHDPVDETDSYIIKGYWALDHAFTNNTSLYGDYTHLLYTGTTAAGTLWLTGSHRRISIQNDIRTKPYGYRSQLIVEGAEAVYVGSMYGFASEGSFTGASATTSNLYHFTAYTAKSAGTLTAEYGFYVTALAATTQWAFFNAAAGANSKIGPGSEQLQFRDDASYIYSDAGDSLSVVSDGQIKLNGDVQIAAGKDLDCYTNAAYFKPRRVSQAAQPTPDAAELLVWRDTDDDKTYIVYNDPDVGVRSVEMT